jgi:hypothetical protein
MAVKLIMSWDIQPEREQEYFEFVVREFIPGVQRLGFELSDAWATVFGSEPQILVGIQMPDRAQMHQVTESEDWKSLMNQLQDYVQNFRQKLVEARAGFQF